jgi:multiple sugar transport system permease protein
MFAPFVLLFIVTTAPFLYTIGTSLFYYILYDVDKLKFIGFKNYLKILKLGAFYNSLFVTVYQVSVTLVSQFALSMLFALLLARTDLILSRIIRKIFLIPMMMTPAISALTWRLLYNVEFGTLNYFLSVLGLQKLNWLGSPILAMPAVIITGLWISTPFMTVILLAGIESLPAEPYEAAIVDGASRFRSFIHITLPLLKPTILVALLFRLMDIFNRFETIYIMTSGGPGRATETLNIYTFLVAFEYMDMGHASTVAVAMIIIMLSICLILIRLFRTR